MPKGRWLLYAALALIGMLSLIYRIGKTHDRLELLFNAGQHVRDPFDFSLPGRELRSVGPEADAAGVRDFLLIVQTGDAIGGAQGGGEPALRWIEGPVTQYIFDGPVHAVRLFQAI